MYVETDFTAECMQSVVGVSQGFPLSEASLSLTLIPQLPLIFFSTLFSIDLLQEEGELFLEVGFDTVYKSCLQNLTFNTTLFNCCICGTAIPVAV